MIYIRNQYEILSYISMVTCFCCTFILEMYEVTSWRQCQSVYAHLSSWIFNLTTNVISFISLGGIIRQTTTLRLLRSWDFIGERIPGSRPVTKLGPNCCHYWGNLGQFTGQRKLIKIGSHLLHEHKKVSSESCSVKSCEPHLQLSASTWPPRTLTQLGKLDYNFNTQAAYIHADFHMFSFSSRKSQLEIQHLLDDWTHSLRIPAKRQSIWQRSKSRFQILASRLRSPNCWKMARCSLAA